MLDATRVIMLVFVATVLLLLVSAMPGKTVQQQRQRNVSYLLVGLSYAALILLYLRIFE